MKLSFLVSAAGVLLVALLWVGFSLFETPSTSGSLTERPFPEERTNSAAAKPADSLLPGDPKPAGAEGKAVFRSEPGKADASKDSRRESEHAAELLYLKSLVETAPLHGLDPDAVARIALDILDAGKPDLSAVYATGRNALIYPLGGLPPFTEGHFSLKEDLETRNYTLDLYFTFLFPRETVWLEGIPRLSGAITLGVSGWDRKTAEYSHCYLNVVQDADFGVAERKGVDLTGTPYLWGLNYLFATGKEPVLSKIYLGGSRPESDTPPPAVLGELSPKIRGRLLRKLMDLGKQVKPGVFQ